MPGSSSGVAMWVDILSHPSVFSGISALIPDTRVKNSYRFQHKWIPHRAQKLSSSDHRTVRNNKLF